jgi:hypothetical protein
VLAPACGSGGGGGTASFGGSETTAAGSTTSAATSAATTTSTSASTSSTGGVDESDDGPIFDVAIGDVPDECEDMCGDGVDFSYIWIASPDQGNPDSTVAKIDTQTLAIEGRYYTRPDTLGNASRTSVNLSGRAVAVANRHGGITKIWARSEDCVDQNGDGLATSMGEGDVLAWGEDDCIAWHTPFPDHQTQRPVAWSAGATCTEEVVWTAGCPGPVDGQGDGGPVFVHRLDGETGMVLDTLQLDEMACTNTGPYGGAVDGDGGFWVFTRGDDPPSPIARVDADNASYAMFEIPMQLRGYGLAIDHAGRPWLSGWQTNDPANEVGAARFDPATRTWDLLDASTFSSLGGLQEAPDGRMWIATYEFAPSPYGVVSVDTETLEIGAPIIPPQEFGDEIKGISIDGEGYLWAVGLYNAYKIDTTDGTVLGSIDLPFAYTYSDMTGWGLSNATCPPAG